MSVFGAHMKVKVFIETRDMKPELKYLGSGVLVVSLSEKSQLVYRLWATCV